MAVPYAYLLSVWFPHPDGSGLRMSHYGKVCDWLSYFRVALKPLSCSFRGGECYDLKLLPIHE